MCLRYSFVSVSIVITSETNETLHCPTKYAPHDTVLQLICVHICKLNDFVLTTILLTITNWSLWHSICVVFKFKEWLLVNKITTTNYLAYLIAHPSSYIIFFDYNLTQTNFQNRLTSKLIEAGIFIFYFATFII